MGRFYTLIGGGDNFQPFGKMKFLYWIILENVLYQLSRLSKKSDLGNLSSITGRLDSKYFCHFRVFTTVSLLWPERTDDEAETSTL